MKRVFKILGLLVMLATIGACGGGGSDSGDSGSGLSNNSCSVIGLPTRIVNGASCGNLNQSAVIRISYSNGQGGINFCSGTMLTSTDVLTAAHCFPNRNAIFAATVTSGDSIESGRDVAIAQILIHPGYVPLGNQSSTEAFYDAAILRLAEPLAVPTLPILVSQDVQVGDEISIFGYGTDENGFFDGEQLQSGEMLVSDVTSTHIQADYTGEGSDTCNGDSGGPAVLVGSGGTGIVGITSTGTSLTCQPPDISLFTNVQSPTILNFITNKVPAANVI